MTRTTSHARSNAHPATLRALSEDVEQQEAILREGGSKSGHERQRKLGRLPVRERLERLLDPKTAFLELGLWAGFEMYPDLGNVPAAGVVIGIGVIRGRHCMVIANDATVKAGAFFPATVKKVLRAQRIAGRCNLPLIYLVDSSGVYLPMQDEIFPDEDDFGRIFRNNAVLSAMGVSQIAAIMGNCVAGGAYLPVLCDKILMTKGSALYLAGPSLVKAAIGQETTSEELGGADMHAHISGTVDFLESDDESCIERIRLLVNLLRAEPTEPEGVLPAERDANDLYDIVGLHGHKEYDMHELLRCIIDSGTFQEYKADFGKTLICAYCSIGGTKVGIVANQHGRSKSGNGELQIGGVVYRDSADKAARFVMDCSQTGLPILFVQDVVGFMVGRDAEQHGIIRSGAKLVNAVSNAAVPKITLIVGGSFGAGNYALCGKAFDSCFVFAWPNARYAVMGAEQAADTLLSVYQRQSERGGKQLDDAELQQLHDRIKADYERQTDIRYGAARGWVDAIISPAQTREVLITALRLATRPPAKGGFAGGVIQV